MSDLTIATGAVATGLPETKGLELPVIQKGTKDFLDFMDASKEVFYAYLYHRTGSETLAQTLLSEIYIATLSRSLSLLSFGTLHIHTLFDRADKALTSMTMGEADIDKVYIPKLVWLGDAERQSAATLHDSLWTLTVPEQRVLILSMLLGFSDERIAETLSMKQVDVSAALLGAKKNLIERWQPIQTLAEKLDSLVFMPSLDLKNESKLRLSIVEKYNALRFRRYQWVILAGLFAVMSNVIVAGILAFAVIVTPSSSLRGTKTQVASLDALLVRREYELHAAKRSVASLAREVDGLTTAAVSRDLTELGFGAASDAIKAEKKEDAETERLLKVLKQAGVAMQPTDHKRIVSLLRRQ